MLPSILAKQLNQGIYDYLETTFPMVNEPFKGSIYGMVNDDQNFVTHKPFIAARLPFRVSQHMPECFTAVKPSFLPYVHQQRAFDRLTGDNAQSTLVATGTGSGKTECFLYPILEYCYQHRRQRGIKALIIYPMNALATDQAKRIAKLIYNNPQLRGNVSVGMFLGGLDAKPSFCMSEDGVITDHETMRSAPPNILLTNYKMLDYLLVRPNDASLWQYNTPEILKYIAVDELHTFDGAQGTDLACLLRRLKQRLGTPQNYLCCIGTSATMGSKDSCGGIVEYATELFGEPFSPDSVVTEDRLSAEEFLADAPITQFAVPNEAQLAVLDKLVLQDDEPAYLETAVKAWFPDFAYDVMSDDGRIHLADSLIQHNFLHALMLFTQGAYFQSQQIAAHLSSYYPLLKDERAAESFIDSFYALVSYARISESGRLMPFLNVQVQLWMRELSHLVAKIDGKNVTYRIADNLSPQNKKNYLPVVNCRDCGATGWVSVMDLNQKVALADIFAFYNLYFNVSEKITMMFPYKGEPYGNFLPAKLCPSCQRLSFGGSAGICPDCGVERIDVLVPNNLHPTNRFSRQFACPFCGSGGISIMGVGSASEASVSISQLFSSRFNDDKKTLAFSDNVQDAAHHSGFFNSRTWRFGLRRSVQQYCADQGTGKSLEDFQNGFIEYYRSRMSDEEFAALFIAPNMTWMSAYEDMVKTRSFNNVRGKKALLSDIEKRLKYEIMLEYGMLSDIGRTLEKSGCSVLSFSMEDITAIADAVQERVINEIGVLRTEDALSFRRMVAGYLNIMRKNGAFNDDEYTEFTKSGTSYLLSNDHKKWMPGVQHGRNVPEFIAESIGGSKSKAFDPIDAGKYDKWVKACNSNHLAYTICSFIVEEAKKRGVISVVPSAPQNTVYALNKKRIYVTDKVVRLCCNKCRTAFTFPEENEEIWTGAPCSRPSCDGTLEISTAENLNYYGRLYSNGDMVRVNSRDHTGLLDRSVREDIEENFKRSKDTHAAWDPNVLSCTPTLEMGIDIGDLSTVVLCSMPPSQSQFLQRTGRAGRKDGNALTLVISRVRPHDMYFYEEPLDMIGGYVAPPKIFLRASAVLERQFVAFCMDTWVKSGISDNAIQKKVGIILKKYQSRPDDLFPFNFLNYVQSNRTELYNSFIGMFGSNLDDATCSQLSDFVNGTTDKSMILMFDNAFGNLLKQYNTFKYNIKSLNEMIKQLEAKPEDSSYKDEIAQLKTEKNAVISVINELEKKNIFNFLSDEGILPNYAFPEAGIVLRAVLYRRDDEDKPTGKKKYETKTLEYSRSASSAISEFAPNNSFYADGRKLKIDQVDLTTAHIDKWRLCPNCSHAQKEDISTSTAVCPQCGSPGWGDSGQVRSMLKVRMVYSNSDYTKTLISDESEDRTNTYYYKQLLVDVDEDRDIVEAYQMSNDDFPFGYEFVRKATVREINFGESDLKGEKFHVAGVEASRKGFKICKYCGKIQFDDSKENHALTCKTRNFPPDKQTDIFEDCLFLYRELETEIIRLLIPSFTLDYSVRVESFVAAFMLGLKEYFGNVDHLRTTISEVPVQNSEYKKRYLVVYDSVPGGTGYLKQLMANRTALLDVLEKALYVMENCSCKNDPEKNGCYHCLFAYRQSNQIGNISRTVAISLLRSILSGKENIKKINSISNISINTLFDSELEQRFVEALKSKVGNFNLSDIIRNGKHCYYIKFENTAWEVEPQVLIGSDYGVHVTSKPDFVFWPVKAPNHKPVAVFTDGFSYHKNIVADDTVKREAIRRSGAFRVWSLSYKDIQNIFASQGEYSTPVFNAERMPYGNVLYKSTIRKFGAERLDPSKKTSFDLLIEYLKAEDAEALLRSHAFAYSLCLLNPALMGNNSAFEDWQSVFKSIEEQMYFSDSDFAADNSVFGIWKPRETKVHLKIYAGITVAKMKSSCPATVCALLDDSNIALSDTYEGEWNGYWHFCNLMQFTDEFVFVTSSGIENRRYCGIPANVVHEEAIPDENGWGKIKELLFDREAKEFADIASSADIPVPDEENIGIDITDGRGVVIATAEIVWKDKNIVFLTNEQTQFKNILEANGWKIAGSDIDSIIKLFGGE